MMSSSAEFRNHIPPLQHIDAMTAYALADLSVSENVRLVSMAQNESIRPPSPAIKTAVQEKLEQAALYPDPDWHELSLALAKAHDLSQPGSGQNPCRILCGAGSMELIACLGHAYLDADTHVLTSEYAYVFFKTVAQFRHASFSVVAEENYTVCVDRLLAAVQPDTRIVFVANPGNPSGTAISREEMIRLRADLPQDVLLVVDEAYGEFAQSVSVPVFDLVEQGNTVVLRTFSKAYGLAGMRVGWGLFPRAVAGQVRKLLNPNNISVLSQTAATAAVNDQAYMLETVRQTIQIRDAFIQGLRAAGLAVPDSYTNFVLIPFASPEQASHVHQRLRENGFFMRPVQAYGLGHCLRATVVAEADMQQALAVLQQALGE